MSKPQNNTHEIVDNETGKYVVYKLYVQTMTSSYFLIRRYSEFRALFDILKKRYPNYNLKIPPKKLFGNFSQSTITQRIKGLNEFIQAVVIIPNIFSDDAAKEFFRTDDPRNQKLDVEDDQDMKDSGVNSGPGDDITNEMVGLTLNKKAAPEDFTFTKVIGKGSFGRVFLAQHKESGKYFAIKVLAKSKLKSEKEQKHLMSERNVLLENIKHPFLVALHYSFQNSTKLYFVLDYVNGGELFYHLQKEKHFEEYRAKFYAAEIACALGYLHGRHIIYRDLKPENLLLDRYGHIVITDFGLAKERMDQQTDGKTGTFCGTPEYLAPEVLHKRPYTYALDWWCLGSVLYEMIFGAPPFYCRDHMTMYDRIKNKPLEFGKAAISSDGKSVLTQMLQKDPDARLGTKGDLAEIQAHPFFKPLEFTRLENREIAPPYKPNVATDYDTSNIDREFLRSPVTGSVGRNDILAGVAPMNDNFTGFSYAPPYALGGGGEN